SAFDQPEPANVQDPQSAVPVRTTSEAAATSSITVAGGEAPGLRHTRTAPAPARSTRRSASRPSSTSALGLELSRMPMRRPRRSRGRGANGFTSARGIATGQSTFMGWQYSATPASAPKARAGQREEARDADRDGRGQERFAKGAQKADRGASRGH